MPLHPEVQAFLAAAGAAMTFPTDVLSDPAAAARYLAVGRQGMGREAVSEATEVALLVDGLLPGGRPVRLYVPDGEGPFPVLVYFHGGGWVLGNLEMHDEMCRRLANGAACVVMSVDYRLAPEHPFPAALEDGVEAVSWAVSHASEWHGDGSRIAVGGTSSGGNLAAAVALRCRDQGGPPLCLQVLMYPVLDAKMDTGSYRSFGEGPILTSRQMRWYWDQYVPDLGDRGNPHASPAAAEDLGGLPPALFVLPECDPLRDEGETYAARLSAAGVDTRELSYPGQIHSFLRLLGVLSDADTALVDIAGAMREMLAAAACHGAPPRPTS